MGLQDEKGESMNYDTHLQSVTPTNNFELFVEFDNGVSGTVKADPSHLVEMLEPLTNIAFFNSAFINEDGILTWPNGADFCTGEIYSAFINGNEFII